MVEKKEDLTNEKIRACFANPFDLVNHAIRLAEEKIQQGSVHEEENIAQKVMMEILEAGETQNKEFMGQGVV